ncbi:hypothetical protein CP061683_0906B, partial [Chlamydia psittaci 06-1683]
INILLSSVYPLRNKGIM